MGDGTYLYRIAWVWWEDYEPYVLAHKKKFDDNEWNEMIREAMTKAIKEPLSTDYYIGMDVIVEKLVEILCRDYGFRKVEYVQDFKLWGSIIIDDYDADEIEQLNKYIDNELINEILKHNEDERRKLWEDEEDKA